MSVSVSISIVLAVLLFWAVGAYNRLVRLRALAVEAFKALDAQFAQYVALVQHSFSMADNDAAPPAQAGLMGAAVQFELSMKVAREHPLDELVMRALETAHEAFSTSWGKMRNEPPDLAGARVPEAMQQQWDHITQGMDKAKCEFNRRVAEYNRAVLQFPARMLASVIGFKRAHLILDAA